MWFFLSLYLQQVLGYSPIKTGLAFLPMTLCIVARLDDRLAGRDPVRRQAAAGRRDGRPDASGCCCSRTCRSTAPTSARCSRRRCWSRSGSGSRSCPRRSSRSRASTRPRRARLGARQHLAAVRRRARAGDPGGDRDRRRPTPCCSSGGHGLHAALTSGFQLAFIVAAGFALVGGLVALVRAAAVRAARRARRAATRSSRARSSATFGTRCTYSVQSVPTPERQPRAGIMRRTVARCFVTRELPGPALERLSAVHEVDVWPEPSAPSPDAARRARRRRRGTAVDARRPDRRAAARPLPEAARDRQLRGRLRQHRPRPRRGRAGSRSATRPTC